MAQGGYVSQQTPRFFIQVPTNDLMGLGLNPTDKYIFGEIYTMLNVTGTCYMSNAKLGEPAEISAKSVSRILTKLNKTGLIDIKLVYKKGTKQVERRYIYLSMEYSTGMLKSEQGVCSNSGKGMLKSEQENILTNIKPEEENTQLKTYKSAWLESEKMSPLTAKKLKDLCNKHGKELFDYAINLAVESNVTFPSSYRYLNKLLSDWSKNNVKDVQGAKKYVTGRKKKMTRKSNNHGRKPIKENLPAWALESDEDKKARRDKEKAEHKYKMEHDPEYRKQQEATDKRLNNNLRKIRSLRGDSNA